MNNSKIERSFPISKDILDTINSVTWFLADASWMSQFTSLAIALMIPTLITSICLLYIERRLPVFMINISINCWVLMNFLWILSDAQTGRDYIFEARIIFALGLMFIIFAAILSRNVRETFSHFRRFRTKQEHF